MTMTLQALRDEILNDPAAIGYKEAGGAWKADDVIAGLLNTVGVGVIRRHTFTGAELVASLALAEFEALSVARRQYVQFLCALPLIDGREDPIFNGLSTCFAGAGGVLTRTALLAKIQRQGSRAEVLWGEGSAVAARDVGAAANL